jgi:hypothetical protein
MPIDTQVVLMSDQPTPNLTPVLDSEYRPRTLIMVSSPDRREQTQWLAEALRDTGIGIEVWPIDDAWDAEHIRDRVRELLARHGQEDIALNVSSGTKPMAIAAYEVFRDQGRPIFYVHPETDHLIWMYHPRNLPSRDLADRVKLPRFLRAHGTRLRAQGPEWGIAEPLRDLGNALVHAIDSYRAPLATVNWAAGTARQGLVSAPIPAEHWTNAAFLALLDLFERAGILEIDGRRLAFSDEPARFCANGGWLEAYVWDICLGLVQSAGIQDIARNLDLERQSAQGVVRNEIDLAFLANNRLYVIECKTHKFDPNPGAEGKGAQALFKLDTLRDLLGGLNARALLVSYRPLKPHDLQRAADLKIQVCDGARLKGLARHLRDWVLGPPSP